VLLVVWEGLPVWAEEALVVVLQELVTQAITEAEEAELQRVQTRLLKAVELAERESLW
jgi:hypothetical protein